jgi:hypothetical protein
MQILRQWRGNPEELTKEHEQGYKKEKRNTGSKKGKNTGT